jgi:uncharacterized protein (TIGR02594 family)
MSQETGRINKDGTSLTRAIGGDVTGTLALGTSVVINTAVKTGAGLFLHVTTNEPVARSGFVVEGAVTRDPDQVTGPVIDLEVKPKQGTFVRAMFSPNRVVYEADDGTEVVRIGGTRSWRNKNPGNIEGKSGFARKVGAISNDGRFAIFPDEDTGFVAIKKLLSAPDGPYSNLTLAGAINKYAPPDENDTAAYLKSVSAQANVSTVTLISALNDFQLGAVATAIKKIEGWRPGKEEPNTPESLAANPQIISGRPAVQSATEWIDIAKTEAALPPDMRTEVRGPAANPEIIIYFNVGVPRAGVESDEVPWCAAFANYCLVTAGYAGTNSAWSGSFFNDSTGRFVTLPEPQFGCIVIFRDNPQADDNAEWKTGSGHVTFFMDQQGQTMHCLGGNQSDTVKVSAYPRGNFKLGNGTPRRAVRFIMPVRN